MRRFSLLFWNIGKELKHDVYPEPLIGFPFFFLE
jgi:hypothetical protein